MSVKIGHFFFSRLKLLFFGTPRELLFSLLIILQFLVISWRDSPKLSVWRWKEKRTLPPNIREPVTCS